MASTRRQPDPMLPVAVCQTVRTGPARMQPGRTIPPVCGAEPG